MTDRRLTLVLVVPTVSVLVLASPRAALANRVSRGTSMDDRPQTSQWQISR